MLLRRRRAAAADTDCPHHWSFTELQSAAVCRPCSALLGYPGTEWVKNTHCDVTGGADRSATLSHMTVELTSPYFSSHIAIVWKISWRAGCKQRAKYGFYWSCQYYFIFWILKIEFVRQCWTCLHAAGSVFLTMFNVVFLIRLSCLCSS